MLPGPVVWDVAHWVVRGFFDDARQHLHDLPGLSDEMQFGYDTGIYSIALDEAPREHLLELQTLIERVVADQLATQGAVFADPSAFPLYLSKLHDLETLVASALSSAPSLPTE